MIGVLLSNRGTIYWVRKQLDNRGVLYHLYLREDCEAGAIIVPKSEIGKLPTDEKGHYIGNNKEGYSTYKITERELRALDYLRIF